MGQSQSDENNNADGDNQQQQGSKKQRKQALRDKFYASGTRNANNINQSNQNAAVVKGRGGGNIGTFSSSNDTTTPWAFVKGSPPIELLKIPAQAPKRFTTRANAGVVDTNLATNVFPCFRGGGMLFRIEDPRDAGWWFYNDTGEMEMHVEYHFAPGSVLDAGEHVVVQPSTLPGQEGWTCASMIVFPGETLPFVSGRSKIKGGFRSVYRIAPLSEQVAQRRAAEIAAVVSKMSNEMEVVAKLNCDVAGVGGFTCLIEDAIVERCARQQVPYVDLNFPPTSDSMYGAATQQQQQQQQRQQVVFHGSSSTSSLLYKKNNNNNNNSNTILNSPTTANDENLDPHSPHRRVAVLNNNPALESSDNVSNSPLPISSIAAEVAGGSKYVSEFGSTDTQLTAQVESDARDLHRRLPPTVWMRPKQFLLSGTDDLGAVNFTLGQVFLRQQQQQQQQAAKKKNNKNNNNDENDENNNNGRGLHGDDDDDFFEQQMIALEAATDATVSCLTRGVRPSDIEFGFLGDHWLQSAVSCVAEYPELIQWIFKDTKPLKIVTTTTTTGPSSSNNTNLDINNNNNLTILKTPAQNVGAYQLCLNVSGWWTPIVLDDYIPCIGNKPAFASSRRDRRELWPVLLQKAFAKLRGSYVGLVGGDPLMAVRSMTGCPTFRFDDEWAEAVRNSVDKSEPDEFFISTYLMEPYVQGFMLCLNTRGIDAAFSHDLSESNQLHCQRIVSKYESVGLQMGCCYSVVDMKYFPQWKLFLLKIRNPWLWTAGAQQQQQQPQQQAVQQQQTNNDQAATGLPNSKSPSTNNLSTQPQQKQQSFASASAAVGDTKSTTTTNQKTNTNNNNNSNFTESSASTMTGSWTGNWSWGSVLWERFPEVAAACRLAECKAEGDNFWMSWEDAISYFDGGGVCFYRSAMMVSEHDLAERRSRLFGGVGVDINAATAAAMAAINTSSSNNVLTSVGANNNNNINASFTSNNTSFTNINVNSSFSFSSAFNNLLTNASNFPVGGYNYYLSQSQKMKSKIQNKNNTSSAAVLNENSNSRHEESPHQQRTPSAISASPSQGNYSSQQQQQQQKEPPNVMQTLSAVSFIDSSGTSSPVPMNTNNHNTSNTVARGASPNENNNTNQSYNNTSQQLLNQNQNQQQRSTSTTTTTTFALQQPKPMFDQRVLGQFIDSLSSVCLEVAVFKRTRLTFILSQADNVGSRAEPFAAMMLSIATPASVFSSSSLNNSSNNKDSSGGLSSSGTEHDSSNNNNNNNVPLPYIVQWNSTLNPLSPSADFTFNFARDLSIIIELDPSPKNAPYLIIPRVFDAGVNKRYVLGLMHEEPSCGSGGVEEVHSSSSSSSSYCAKFVQLNADSFFFLNRRQVTHLPYYCQQQTSQQQPAPSPPFPSGNRFSSSLSRPVKARYQVKRDREFTNNNNNEAWSSSLNNASFGSMTNFHQNNNNNNSSGSNLLMLGGSSSSSNNNNNNMIAIAHHQNTETYETGFLFESIGTEFKIPKHCASPMNNVIMMMSRGTSKKF